MIDNNDTWFELSYDNEMKFATLSVTNKYSEDTYTAHNVRLDIEEIVNLHAYLKALITEEGFGKS
jgi:hypothetical protein